MPTILATAEPPITNFAEARERMKPLDGRAGDEGFWPIHGDEVRDDVAGFHFLAQFDAVGEEARF